MNATCPLLHVSHLLSPSINLYGVYKPIGKHPNLLHFLFSPILCRILHRSVGELNWRNRKEIMIMIRFTVMVAVLMALFNSEYAHAKVNMPLTNRFHGVRDGEKDASLLGLRFPSLWGIRGGSTPAAGLNRAKPPSRKMFYRLFFYRQKEGNQESAKEVEKDRSAV